MLNSIFKIVAIFLFVPGSMTVTLARAVLNLHPVIMENTSNFLIVHLTFKVFVLNYIYRML